MSRRHEPSAISGRSRGLKRFRVSTRSPSASPSPPPRRRYQTSTYSELAPQVKHNFEEHTKLLNSLRHAHKIATKSTRCIPSSEARIRMGGLETIWKDLKRAASYATAHFSGPQIDQIHLDQIQARVLYQATRAVLQQAMFNREIFSPLASVAQIDVNTPESPNIQDESTSVTTNYTQDRQGQSIIRVEVQAPHPDEGKVGTFSGDYSKWLALKADSLLMYTRTSASSRYKSYVGSKTHSKALHQFRLAIGKNPNVATKMHGQNSVACTTTSY